MKQGLPKSGTGRFALLMVSLLISACSWAQNSNITISTANTSGGAFSGGVFTPTANGANIKASDLVAQINSNINVTINTACGSCTQSGNITTSTTVAALPTSTTQFTLTVNAGENITISNAFTFTATAGSTVPGTNVTLNADAGTSPSGSGTVTVSAALTTTGATNTNANGAAGGNITISAPSGITISGALTANGGGGKTTGGGGTGGNAGNISLTSAAGITLSANLTASAGTGKNGSGTNGNFTIIDGASTYTAGSGSGVNDGQWNASGVITGGNLTVSGSGTFIMAGANVYTGTTTISNGILKFANNETATSGPVGAGGNVTVQSGGSIDLAGWSESGTAAETLTISGTGPDGNGALRNTGNGDNYARAIVLASNPASIAGIGSTLTITGGVTGSGNTLTLDGPGGGVISTVGVSTSSGGITKINTGTWTLSIANSYTGTTTVSAGTLAYGASNLLSGAVTVNGSTAILSMGAFSDAVGTVILDGGGRITGTTGTLTTTGTYDFRSGSVSAILAGGTGIPLNKTTSGTVTLSGTNTYTGVTTISAGTLSVATIGNGGTGGNLGAATAAAANVVLSGGTLQYTGASASTNRAFTLTAATSSTINVTNTLTMTGGSAASTGALVVAGTGNLLFSTTATAYTGGTTVSSGSTLTMGLANVMASTGTLTLNGGTFATGTTTGFGQTIGALILGANSNFNFGTGSHTITFAASNTQSWTASTMLTINGWLGAYNGTGGTSGKIIVGNSTNNLTGGQLGQIQFYNTTYSVDVPATIISSTAEVVPKFTAPSGLTYNSSNVYTAGSTVSLGPSAVTGVVTSYSINPTTLPTGLSLNAATGFISGTPTVAGGPSSFTVTATNPGGSTNSNTFTITINPATASTFTFSAIGTQTAGTNFSVTITALDVYGNTATGFTGTANMTTNAGTITPATSNTFTAGVLSQNFSVTQAGSSKTITATSTSPSAAGTSGTFTVNGATASTFIFSAIGTQTAGTNFSVTITALDAYGNTATGFTGTANMTTNAGTITPAISNAFAAGELTQSFSVTQAGSSKTITATSSSPSATGTSGTFTVNGGTATSLVMSAVGATQTAGTNFSVTITAYDAYGNVANGFTGTANMTTNAGSISPTISNAFAAGVLTENFYVTQAGSSKTITATTTSPSLNVTSNTFTVNPGTASAFGFSAIGTQTAGTNFSVTITALDAYGNTATGFTGAANMTTNAGTISPSTSNAFASGVLTENFNVTQAGSSKTITATSTSPSATGTSSTFTVNGATAASLSMSAIGTPQTAGTNFSVTITAKDVYGNTADGFTGTANMTTNAGTISPATSNAFTAGVLTQNFFVTQAGTLKTTTATTTSPSLNVTSNTFAVNGGTASSFTISNISSPQAAGVAFPVTITALDAYGNTATGFTGTANMTTTAGTISPVTSNAFTAGVLTQSFSVTQLGSSQTITATSTSPSATGTSNAFSVNPGPATKLVITPNIVSPQTAGSAFGVTVQAQDNYGNASNVTSSTGISLAASGGTGTLSGNTGTISNGTSSITISTVSYTQATTLTFTASRTSGMTLTTSAASNSVVINAGAFAKLQLIVPGLTSAPGISPGYSGTATAQTAGVDFSVTVNSVDANWNLVNSAPADNVSLSSSDVNADLPNNAPLSSGTVTFSSSVELATTGSQTLTASDASNGGIANSPNIPITVNAYVTAATDYFQSQTSGNWTTPATWQSSHNNIDWFTSTLAPTSSAKGINIQAGNTVTATATPSSANLTVNGTYVHNVNGGTIPTGSWASTSLLSITGMSTLYPSGMGQSFNNVSFGSTLTGNVEMSSSLTTAGYLTIANAGTSTLLLSNSSTTRTITVGGIFNMNSGNFTLAGSTGGGSLTSTSDFDLNGGLLTVKNSTGSGTASIAVSGSFNSTGGILNMDAYSGGTSTMQVAGNFSFGAGTIEETSTGSGNIVFNGTGIQTYTSGGTLTTTINFTVNNNATLQMAANGTIVSGTGTFTVANGGTLGITSALGITTTGATGNIQVSGTRAYTSGANYIYNGSANQVTGNGLTQNTPGDLTFNNPNTVTLSAATTISGDLTIQQGTFSTSSGNLALNVGGSWVNDGLYSGGTSAVSFTGSGDIGGTSSTAFAALTLSATASTYTMSSSNSATSLTFAASGTATSLTHTGTSSLTISGAVTLNQPTASAISTWNINAGYASVSGLISFPGNNTTTTRISKISITTGELDANGGITFTASASATKVIDMSGGAGLLTLQGALTVPANSSTLTAGTTSTFDYVDNSPQTINYFSAGAYNNLYIDNTDGTTGASLSAAVTTSNVTGNIAVGTVNTGSLFTVGNLAIGFGSANTLTVAANSTMTMGTTSVSFSTSGVATINGTFITANIAGFSGSTSTAIVSTNSPTISLGSNSTIEYNSASVQTVTARTDYANVILASSSKTVAAGTVTLSGDLTIISGATYNGTTNNPALNIGGDFSNSGVFNQGTGTVSFTNGGAANNIIGSSTTSFNNLTINNSYGVLLSGSVGAGIAGTSTLLFSNGMITTNANTLSLASGVTVSSAGAGKYVYGNLLWNIPTGTPTRTFYIGDATNYTPVVVTFTNVTTAGTLLGNTTPGNHPQIATSGINPSLDVNRYWTLTNTGIVFTNSSGTASVTANFVAGDIDAGANYTNFGIKNYNGSSWGFSTPGTLTATSTQGTGFTSFGDFQVGTLYPNIANDNISAAQTICSGVTPAGLTGSTPTGGNGTYTYLWQSSTTSATTGFSNAAGTNNGLNYTLPAALTQTTWYNRTTTSAGLSDVATAVQITVNAIPVATATPSAPAICSGIAPSIALSSTVTGTTYAWNVVQGSAISGGSNSSGTPIAQILSNSSNSLAGTAVYTITPTGPSPTLCAGNPITATVTVNPIPVGSASPQTICSGGPTSVALSSTVTSGSTYTWTQAVKSGAVSNGANCTSSCGSTIAQTLTSTTGGVLEYTITPMANTCNGSTFTADVTVNPLPTSITPGGATTVCSGTGANITIAGSQSGVNYQLRNNSGNGSVGSPVAGGGNINLPTGNITSATTYNVLATNGTTNCSQQMTGTVTISVNQIPVATATNSSQATCNGSTFTSMALSTSNGVTGTTFSWTRDNGSLSTGNVTGIAASGSGSTITGAALTNTTSAPVTVTFTITPTGPTTTFCVGSPITATITVAPASQATGYFRSAVTTGAWSTAGSWQSSADNITWCTSTLVPTSAAVAITIQSGNTITIGAAATASNLTIAGTLTITGSNTLGVTGNWTNNGAFNANTSTVTFNGSTPQTIAGSTNGTFSNLVINEATASNTVTSTTSSFNVGAALTVTQGNLILQATDQNYVVTGAVTVSTNGTLTNGIDWNSYGILLSVGGNFTVSGLLTNSIRSTIEVTGIGTTITSGNTPGSAFDILLIGNTSGTINAGGTLVVNDNFWTQWGATAGTFSTNGQTATFYGGVFNNGGTFSVPSGTVNVSGGIFVGYSRAGTFSFASGTINADVLNVGYNGNGISNSVGTLTQSGGIMNLSSSLLIHSGSTFTASGSPAIYIGGNMADSGTFTPATSTVTFNGSGAQTIYGTAATQTFDLVVLNNPSGSLTVAGSTATLNLNDDFNITAGTFVAGTATSINALGDWINNGGFTSGSGRVTFDATTGLQNIAGSSASTFYNVTLNNSSGLVLGINTNVSSVLTLTSGMVTTGTNTLIMSANSSSSISGYSSARYIYGNLSMGIPNGASVTQTFPIGDASNYTPINLSFTGTVSGSGSLTAFTKPANAPTIATSVINEAEDILRYWSLTNNGVAGFTNYSITTNYIINDSVGNPALTGTNFVMGLYNGSWNYPTVGTRTANAAAGTGLVTATGILPATGFGIYQLGQNGAGVPTMSTQPTSSAVCNPVSTSFTAVANSIPASSIQWQVYNGTTYTNVSNSSPYSINTTYGASTTSSVLTINPTNTSLNGLQYSCIFTNTKGSVTSNAATLTVNPLPAASIGIFENSGGTANDGTICTGAPVTLTANPTSGMTYAWSNTSSTSGSQALNPTATGSYNVTVTNSTTHCSATATATITVPLPSVSITETDNSGKTNNDGTLCNGGSATLTASPTSGENYSWTTSATSDAITVSPASTTPYTVTVTDPNTGCSLTSSSTVTVNQLPAVTITPNYCVGGGNVLLTSTAESSYIWSTGSATQTSTVDEAGTYFVTATDANGCANSAFTTVALELVTNGTFSSGNTGFTTGYNYISPAANAATSGGDQGLVPEGNYAVDVNAHTYHPSFWGIDHTTGTGDFMMVNGDDIANQPIVWQETVTIQPNTVYYFSAWAMSLNTVGNYAELQFDVNGVSVGTIADLGPGPDNTTQAAANNYWQRFYGTWNSGSSTSAIISIIDLQTIAGGNDFGLDDISCSTLSTVSLGTAPANGTSPMCVGGNIVLSSNRVGGESPFTYSWSGPASFTGSTDPVTISSASTSNSGTYDITVTDAHGCSASSSVSVTVNALPTPTFTSPPGSITCSSTNVTYATQTGQSSYVWSVPGVQNTDYTITSGGIGSTNTSVTLQWLTAGSKTVTVNYNNAAGCTATSPASNTTTVDVRPTPTFTAVPTSPICASANALYTTQAGQSNYVWVISGTLNTDYTIVSGSTSSNSVTLQWLTSGNKTVTVNYNDASGCNGLSAASNTTTVNALPTPTFTTAPTPVCNSSTGNIYTTQSGFSNYIWAINGGTITAGGGTSNNTATVTWTTAGTESISVNYKNSSTGCTALSAKVQNVTVNALPTPTFTTAPTPVCNNSTGNVYTTQSGFSNYVWTISGGTITSGGGTFNNTATITWNTAGSESIGVNYKNASTGCAALSATAQPVTVNALPSPSFTAAPATTCVNTPGYVYTTQPGEASYQWTITGGTITAGSTTNSATITWNTSGAETIKVDYVDVNGCTAPSPTSQSVTVQTAPSITTPPTGGTICLGSPLNLSGTASGSSISYQWQLGGSNILGATSSTYSVANANSTDAGNYTLVVSNTACPSATSGTAVVAVTSAYNVPYLETFESISSADQYPNCVTSTNLGTETFTRINNPAVAFSGSNYGSFGPSANDYFFTPGISLNAGTEYIFYYFYNTDNTSVHTSFGGWVGTLPEASSMTTAVGTTLTGSAIPVSNAYYEYTGTFTPTTTGVYYFGAHATSNPGESQDKQVIDNIGIEFACTGTPTAGTASASASCLNAGSGVNLLLSNATSGYGGITYQWQSSAAGLNTWSDISGATDTTYSLNVNSSTDFRCKVTCSYSSQTSTSNTVTVGVNPALFNVTGGACIPAEVGLNGSQTGVSYQLYVNTNTPIGSPLAGTGTSLNFGDQVDSGIYTVIATNPSTGCVSPMTGVATVSFCLSTWIGVTDTSWNAQTNWNPAAVPNNCYVDVLIPAGTPFLPGISQGDIYVRNINISANVTLTLNSHNLNVCGNWTGGNGNNAAVVGNGVVLLNSSVISQTVTGNTKFDVLEIANNRNVTLNRLSFVSIATGLWLVQGNLDVSNGTFTLLSSSASNNSYIDDFSFGVNHGTITGSVTAQRYVPVQGSNQHYISSPVNTPAFSQLNASGPDGAYIIPTGTCDETSSAYISPYGTAFQYNDGHMPSGQCMLGNWEIRSAGNTVNAQGYSVYLTGNTTLSLTSSANTGNVNVSTFNSAYPSVPTLQQTLNGGNGAIESGWALVGNPYPSALDLTVDRTEFGYDNQVQLWKTSGPFAGTWQPATINGQSGTVVIPPFQAFMVHVSTGQAAGNYSYPFYQSERTRTTNLPFYRTQSQNTLQLSLDYNGMKDVTTVSFNPSATNKFDPEYDAVKQDGGAHNPTLYTFFTGATTWYAINTVPSLTQTAAVPVGLIANNTGTMTITPQGIESFDPTTYIYLEDKQTGTWTNLRNGPYTFSTTPSDNQQRFVLHLTPPAVILTQDASCEASGMINIEQPGMAAWNYTVTDNTNTAISTGTLNNNTPVSINVNPGVYTLTLVDANGYTVVKNVEVQGTQTVVASFNSSASTAQVSQNISFTSSTTGASAYSWDFGDGSIGAGASTTHIYAQEGVYNVTLNVENAAGCTSATSHTITVTSRAVTGIANVSGNGDIRIWSNEDRVYVDFSAETSVDADIEIYNVLGQVLSDEKFGKSSIYSKQIVNMEAAYLVIKVTNNGEITTKKVFISNVK